MDVNTHGGKRANSGRKKREETTVLSFRVLTKRAIEIKQAILKLLSDF